MKSQYANGQYYADDVMYNKQVRNVNIFKIKYIIALFRWYFKVSKYIKLNKTNISLSRRMGLPMTQWL